MIKASNKNNLMTWVVLLTDVLAYWVLVHAMVEFLPDYCSPAVVHHPNIAAMIGMLSLLLFSLILPPLIHHRRLLYTKVALRNILVAIFTQCIFGLVWHVMVVETSNEIVYGFFMTLGLFLILLTLRTIERLLLGLLRSKGRNTRSVLFIGNDPANLAMYEELISDSTTGYRVNGYYSDDDIEQAPESFEKLGNYNDFIAAIDGKKSLPVVDEIYCSLSHAEDAIIRKIMKFCDKEVIRFIYVPRIFPNMQLSLKPEIIGNSVVYTNHHEPLMGLTNKFFKRLFDIFFSILFIVLHLQ